MQRVEDKSGAEKETKRGAQSSTIARAWRATWRTLLGVVALLVVAVAVIIAYLGPIVERYVESHDRELVGRHLTMDNLRLGVLDGRFSVDNLTLYEADDTTLFARLGSVDVRMDIAELLDRHIHLGRLHLSSPTLNVEQCGDAFNFDDMAAFISATYLSDETEEQPSEPWRVTVEDIALCDGAIEYYDRALEQRWQLMELDCSTPLFELDRVTNHVEVSTRINDHATFGGMVDIDGESLDYRFDGVLDSFALADTYNYIRPYVNISEFSGDMSVELSLYGNLAALRSSSIEGRASIEELSILAANGGNLLSARRALLDIGTINVADGSYLLDAFEVDGFATQLIIDEDGTTNFKDLFYGRAELSVETTTDRVGDDMFEVRERVTITTDEEQAPLSDILLRIDRLRFSNGEFYYADYTMHRDFSYALYNMSLESDNFDIAAKNRITLRTSLQKQGSALLQWEGSLNDFYNQNLLAMLTNVDITDFSTLVEHYTAFPVVSGNLTFRSQNVVTNGVLSGVNQLGTYNFKVGKKLRDIDAEYKLPLKLGIFILEDRNDNIDVDLPITGRIDSPEFSYRKLLLRAVGNTLLKVVAAPVMWMFPERQDLFRHIDIDMLAAGFDSEHYARLDKMAEVLKENPDLQVRLTQRVNYKRAKQRIADLNLKIAYYNSTQQNEDERFDMLDFAHISEMRLSRSEVANFADSQLMVRGIDPKRMSAAEKSMALYGDMVDEQLRMLLEQRNRIIEEYMAFQHQTMPERAFRINSVVLDELRDYEGKDRYSVTLVIDDEEYEAEPAADASADVSADASAEQTAQNDDAAESAEDSADEKSDETQNLDTNNQ